MNTAPKTSLRLTASALALAAGLAISAISGAAVAQPATYRGPALEGVGPAAFGLSSERIEVVYAPVTHRGGAPERGDPAAFGLTSEQLIVVRAPFVSRGGFAPKAGTGVIGLAAGY
jgi:hypothetical protein